MFVFVFVLKFVFVLCCVVWCGVVLCCVVWCGVVLCCCAVLLCCVALCCVGCVVLCYVVLQCRSLSTQTCFPILRVVHSPLISDRLASEGREVVGVGGPGRGVFYTVHTGRRGCLGGRTRPKYCEQGQTQHSVTLDCPTATK